MKKRLLIVFFISISVLLSEEVYNITQSFDGTFTFKGAYKIMYNEGSSLEKTTILFNVPSCPVQIKTNSINFVWDGTRSYNYEAKTEFTVNTEIGAFQIIYATYDIFGLHMKNLSNTEAKDYTTGSYSISGKWSSYGNDTSEFLTSVAYIKKVRFKDGTQWVSNDDAIVQELTALNLEKKIEDDAK